jgi:hypothetical protein
MSFYRGQEKAFEMPPIGLAGASDERLKTIPIQFDIPVGDLAPGKYEFQVTVLNPAGPKAAFWQVPVVLVP